MFLDLQEFTFVDLNCLLLFFVHLKLELRIQFPDLNDK